jgi:hypothetical protein
MRTPVLSAVGLIIKLVTRSAWSNPRPIDATFPVEKSRGVQMIAAMLPRMHSHGHVCHAMQIPRSMFGGSHLRPWRQRSPKRGTKRGDYGLALEGRIHESADQKADCIDHLDAAVELVGVALREHPTRAGQQLTPPDVSARRCSSATPAPWDFVPMDSSKGAPGTPFVAGLSTIGIPTCLGSSGESFLDRCRSRAPSSD